MRCPLSRCQAGPPTSCILLPKPSRFRKIASARTHGPGWPPNGSAEPRLGVEPFLTHESKQCSSFGCPSCNQSVEVLHVNPSPTHMAFGNAGGNVALTSLGSRTLGRRGRSLHLPFINLVFQISARIDWSYKTIPQRDASDLAQRANKQPQGNMAGEFRVCVCVCVCVSQTGLSGCQDLSVNSWP